MSAIPDLIRLLDDPGDDDVLNRALGEPEPLDIDENRLPQEDDQPLLAREVVCNDLAEIGPDAVVPQRR